jgi:tRNA 2-thiocytidine biosynthesis protein TtcA
MQRYINNIKKRIGKTIYKHGMICPDDRILVAVSGGKDSLILLEAMVKTIKSLPFKAEIIAAHVIIENMGYTTDLDYLDEFCKALGVTLIYEKYNVSIENNKKSPCFICSWNRRKTLFSLAKQNNCNKLALGHHMDDALQTLLMNMMYHGSISSLPYKFAMFEGRLEVIRPLLDLTNAELEKYNELCRYKTNLKNCNYEDTRRKETEKYIDMISGGKRSIKVNMFRSMAKVFTEYLPREE